LEDFYFVDYFIRRRSPVKDAEPSETNTNHGKFAVLDDFLLARS
jgi:hypothetical protein